MAADWPIDEPGSSKRKILEACDGVFLAIYTAEMLVKIIAYGVHFELLPLEACHTCMHRHLRLP